MSLPPAVYREGVAIVGRVGSGKSHAAKGMIERLLSERQRVCIIDPTSVWWGLRSSPDGTSAGFAVAVFGGPRADVAIHDRSGAALADILAGKNLPSVVDVSDFTMAGRTRFMADFLRQLYQRNRDPLTIVFDEADLFAPQRPMPNQTMVLHGMEQLVRRGRVRGFRPWLITQRPAVIHKDVLSQAATLIAMKLVSPQDRAAIGAWIEGQADREEGKKVLAALPKLRVGEGYVWCPAVDFLKKVAFPPIGTFDSGRTPDAATRTAAPVLLASVDVSGLAQALQLDAKPAAHGNTVHPADAALLAAEYQRGHQRGRQDGLREAQAAHQRFVAALSAQAVEVQQRALALADTIDRAAESAAPNGPAMAAPEINNATAPRAAEPAVTSGKSGTSAAAVSLVTAATTTTTTTKKAASSGVRRMMIALAQRPGLNAKQLGLRAGMSSGSGTFGTYLARLRSEGYLEGGRDAMRLTPAGMAHLGAYEPLPTGAGLQQYWLGELGGGAARMLEALIQAFPDALTKDALGGAAAISPKSGTFGTYLSRLRTLELISGTSALRASEELF